ncbi:MAG: DUF4249 family protein [Bacteroidales bacterium]|nr:DUF4249 family protein [Bacteroidales bacterium]
MSTRSKISSIAQVFIIGSFIIYLTGCTEDFPNAVIRDYKPSVVIECLFTNAAKPHYVYVSKSVPPSQQETSNPIRNCNISLTELGGKTEVLSEISPGKYEIKNTRGKIGKSYHLKVCNVDTCYEAYATLTPGSKIDSLVQTVGFDLENLKEGINVRFYANRLYPDSISYHRLILTVNDTTIGASELLYIYEDSFLQPHYHLPLPGAYDKNDTVICELLTLEKEIYDYIQTFQTLMAGDLFFSDVIKRKPVSNISDNALGYFPASHVHSDTIIIK